MLLPMSRNRPLLMMFGILIGLRVPVFPGGFNKAADGWNRSLFVPKRPVTNDVRHRTFGLKAILAGQL
jgi:hypothetical protein